MKAIRLILTLLIAAGLSSSRAQNTWTKKADFGGMARGGAVGFSIGGKGYIGTGYHNGAIYKDFWEFDFSTNAWTQKADYAGSTTYRGAGFAIGNKGYVGTGSKGGTDFSKDFWEYDPAANTWTQKADFGGSGRYAVVSFSIGSKGYVGTGFNWGANGGTATNLKDFWEYDPTTDQWTKKADYAGGICNWASGFSIGNKGYIGTGITGNPFGGILTNQFWEYDPVSDTWTKKANFGGTARNAAVGFAIGDKGYIGTGTDGSLTKDFWEYDPVTDVWTQKANFGGTARNFAVGFAIGNSGYIGTGNDGIDKKDFWEYTLECTGGLTVFLDADADGFGDELNSLFVSDCVIPGGYVSNNTDCNDANSSIHPGAIEVCNSIDDNCNGVLDDACGDGCTVPANPVSGNITGSKAKLSWDYVATALSYKIHYKMASASAWSTPVYTAATSKYISGLTPNTLYYWEVKSACSKDNRENSEWSAQQSFTTAAFRMGDVQTSTLQLYPNPVTESFTLDLQLNATTPSAASIYLLNSLGQIVFSSNEVTGNGTLSKEISMPSTAASGWYIVRVVMSDQVMEKKLLYQK